MDNGEVDIGELIVDRLIARIKENKIVWISFNSEFHTTYRGIIFRIIPQNNGWALYAYSSPLNFSRVANAKLSDLVDSIREQDQNLDEEKRKKILSDMLGKGHLQIVLEILGQ